MKNYLIYSFKLKDYSNWNEILIAELSDFGFESFEEIEEIIKAYISEDSKFEIDDLKIVPKEQILNLSKDSLPNVNYNAECSAIRISFQLE